MVSMRGEHYYDWQFFIRSLREGVRTGRTRLLLALQGAYQRSRISVDTIQLLMEQLTASVSNYCLDMCVGGNQSTASLAQQDI